MTREEQNLFLNKGYNEAIRYMDNAKEFLGRAKKDDDLYTDKKYVRVACSTAYSGVLVALDFWFALKDVKSLPKKQRKSVDYYKRNISILDKKMSDRFDNVYEVLHLSGYYDGITSVKVISAGFEIAYQIIEKIKPEYPVEVAETQLEKIKHKLGKPVMYLTVFFRI